MSQPIADGRVPSSVPAPDRRNPPLLRAVGPQHVVLFVVAVGMVITSAISYQHEYALARFNGQVQWVSWLVPFSLDGMILVAGVGLYWAARNGIRGWARLWQPRGVMAAGIVATIAANLFSDYRMLWLGPGVSASSGAALVLMSAVAFWLLAEQRKLAKKEEPQPAADCTCPAPPTSLAEALPLAKSRLQAAGEQFGEQALADRFGVTRHKVRAILSPAVNGSGGADA